MTQLSVSELDEGSPRTATIRDAARGDRQAFERIVAAHQASMAKVAYVVAGDLDVARDAVQSAWTIAWRRLGSLRDPEQVGPWLVAIAANEARQSLRRQRRSRVVDLSPDLAGPVGGDPADAIGIVDLGRALQRLDVDERSLIALRYIAGLDSTQIAAQLGISASGVRSRLSRLIDRLRLDLDHD